VKDAATLHHARDAVYRSTTSPSVIESASCAVHRPDERRRTCANRQQSTASALLSTRIRVTNDRFHIHVCSARRPPAELHVTHAHIPPQGCGWRGLVTSRVMTAQLGQCTRIEQTLLSAAAAADAVFARVDTELHPPARGRVCGQWRNGRMYVHRTHEIIATLLIDNCTPTITAVVQLRNKLDREQQADCRGGDDRAHVEIGSSCRTCNENKSNARTIEGKGRNWAITRREFFMKSRESTGCQSAFNGRTRF
jgi:hypothetical protein